MSEEANTAVELDGNNDFIRLPDDSFSDFSDGLSMEVWLKPNAPQSAYEYLFNLGGNSGDRVEWYREYNSNNLQLYVMNNGSQVGSVSFNGVLQPGVWQHLVLSVDPAGQVRLYKDGQLFGTGVSGLPRNVARSNNFLGTLASGSWRYPGGMDEAAIYGSALSAHQVQAHYNRLGYGTVKLELMRQGNPVPVLTIAEAVADNTQRYTWMVPASLSESDDYLLRISAPSIAGVLDSSDETFLITNGGQHYYVNDAMAAGDVFTTGLGNNTHSGKTPDRPLQSVAALLTAYDLDPGDIVHVDTGSYRLIRNIPLAANDSGVRIEGPESRGRFWTEAIGRPEVMCFRRPVVMTSFSIAWR